MAIVKADECDFFSLELRRDGGAPMVGFTKIAYPWDVEREHVRGASPVPLGMTDGRLAPGDGSLTANLGTYASLSSQPAWCRDPHVLTLVYSRRGLPQHRVVLRGVRFGGSDESDEEGAEALKREVKFKFERIFLNGFCPLTGESETGAVAS